MILTFVKLTRSVPIAQAAGMMLLMAAVAILWLYP